MPTTGKTAKVKQDVRIEKEQKLLLVDTATRLKLSIQDTMRVALALGLQMLNETVDNI